MKAANFSANFWSGSGQERVACLVSSVRPMSRAMSLARPPTAAIPSRHHGDRRGRSDLGELCACDLRRGAQTVAEVHEQGSSKAPAAIAEMRLYVLEIDGCRHG